MDLHLQPPGLTNLPGNRLRKKRTSASMATVVVPAALQSDVNSYYGSEQQRLCSFRNWPSWAGLRLEDLAREGFYYTGIRDEVKCFSCGVLLRLWKPEDQIRLRHNRYSPRCAFVKRLDDESPRDVPAKFPEIASNTLASSDMKMEVRRLATFDSRWPTLCPVKPTELARSGFYFKGKDDWVQCFACCLILKNWQPGDTPEGEHRKYKPLCPFLTEEHNRNVPMTPSVQGMKSPAQLQTVPPSNLQLEHVRLRTFRDWPSKASVFPEDLAQAGFYYTGKWTTTFCFQCGVQVEEWFPGDVPLDKHLRRAPHCLFINAVYQKRSKTAKMSLYADRLASFRLWPKSTPVSAESLAEAGFFYAGSGDGVICFSCGGALKDWEKTDMAWGEHAKYFPSCQFLKDNTPNTRNESQTESQKVSESHYQASPTTHLTQQFDDHLRLTGQGEKGSLSESYPKENEEGIRLCKICGKREMDILFLPCAHILSCGICAPELTKCPACMADVQKKVRSYFA